MSAEPGAYYELLESAADMSRYRATRHTVGPWTPAHQHGSPPAAVLARELETWAIPQETHVCRFTMDLLGPIPVGEVVVATRVVRPGRAVTLVRAEMTDPATERVVAGATAWCVPARTDGPQAGGQPPPGSPKGGSEQDLPPGWVRGYADSIEWRWVEGQVGIPGPGTVWMRPRFPLLAGERLSPLQLVLLCVDSASGIGAELDLRRWDFRNTDLSVHLVRPAAGEWVALAAHTVLAGTGAGLARATLYDESGVIGASAQALLVRPRTP